MRYKLLTPGPLTTTDTVKREMMIDHCTWDDDYKSVTQKIRAGLLKLAHVSEEEYTSVLIQGSGTFGVEAAITTLVGEDDYLLILANGAYGERMADIAHHAGISYHMRSWAIDEQPDAQTVKMILQENKSITHVAMVHSETTSGILNDVQSIGRVVKEAGATFIVDAMSSFAGVDIPVREWGIDCIISSANKCIQGVPGFAYVIVRKDLLAACEGNARSLALDLYDQWKTMNVDGKWRFTSPTQPMRSCFARNCRHLDLFHFWNRRCRARSSQHFIIRPDTIFRSKKCMTISRSVDIFYIREKQQKQRRSE